MAVALMIAAISAVNSTDHVDNLGLNLGIGADEIDPIGLGVLSMESKREK